MMNYDEAREKRKQLIELIAEAADEIRQIDADLPILQSQAPILFCVTNKVIIGS